MTLNNWESLERLFSEAIADPNSPIAQTLSGDSLIQQGKALGGHINKGEKYSDTQKTQAQMDAIIKAFSNTKNTESLGALIKKANTALRDMGVALEGRVVTVGKGQSLEIRPRPIGDTQFYGANGRGTQLKVTPWKIPLDNNGVIYYNGQERNNNMYARSTAQGDLQILTGIELGLKRAIEQLSYNKNRQVLQKGFGGTGRDLKAALKRFNYIGNTQMQSAIAPGTALNPYNAATLNDLAKSFAVQSSAHRNSVVQSSILVDNPFDQILNKHLKGKTRSFAERDYQKQEYMQLIQEMGLIMRTLKSQKTGTRDGFREVMNDKKFDPITKSSLGAPVVKMLNQLIDLGLDDRSSADENGYKMTYLGGSHRPFADLAPKGSRKMFQTELVKQAFLNSHRGNAFTRGAVTATGWEKRVLGKEQLQGKAYDTTRTLYIGADVLSKAMSALKDKHKGKLVKEELASIENGGMLFNVERMKEMSSASSITKTLSNAVINAQYEKAYNYALKKAQKENPKITQLTDEVKDNLVREAVINAMSSVYSDKFNKKQDVITFGDSDISQEVDKSLDDFVKIFKQGIEQDGKKVGYRLNTTGTADQRTTNFGISVGGQHYKHNKNHYESNPKVVTPGGQVRATGQGVRAPIFNELLGFIAQQLGVDVGEFKGVQAISESYTAKNKNIIDDIVGSLNDAFGQYQRMNPSLDNIALRQSFKQSVIDFLPKKYKGNKLSQEQRDTNKAIDALLPNTHNFENLMDHILSFKDGDSIFTTTNDPEILEEFKHVLPLVLEAYAFTGSGGNKGLFKDILDKDNKSIFGNNNPFVKGTPKGIQDALLKNIYAARKAGTADDFSYQYANDYKLLSLMYGTHDSKIYGDPLSKGGFPASYGYREISDRERAIAAAERIRSRQTGSSNTTGGYYDLASLYNRALSEKTVLSKSRWRSMTDFAQQNVGDTWNLGVTPEAIQQRGGMVLDIEEILNQVPDALSPAEMNAQARDVGDSNLLLKDQLDGKSYAQFIVQKRIERFKQLDKELQEKYYEASHITDEEYRERASLLYPDRDIENLTEEEKLNIRAELGSAMIPVGVTSRSKDAPIFSAIGAHGEQLLSNTMYAPYFGTTRRKNAAGAEVVDFGPDANLWENAVGKFAQAQLEGFAGIQDLVGQDIGKTLFTLGEEQLEHLSIKGANNPSLFDQAHTSPLAHSTQQITMSLERSGNEDLSKYSKYLQGALVVSPEDLNDLLKPNHEEQQLIDKKQVDWGQWLLARYADMYGLAKNEADQAFKSIEHDLKVRKARNKGIDTKDEDKINGINLTSKEVEDELRKRIVQGATLGSHAFSSRGLMGLVNRYPTITNSDVLNTKIFASSMWKNQRGKIGGDQALMDFMNADYDGDHLVLALPFSDAALLQKNGLDSTESQIKGLSQERELSDTIRKNMAFASFIDKEVYPSEAKKLALKGEAFSGSSEDLAARRDTEVAKANKIYTGPLSNLRQAVERGFHLSGIDTSIEGDEGSLAKRIAADAMVKLLSIPEQTGISSKKTAAGANSGWRTAIRKIHALIKNPDTLNSKEGLSHLLDVMSENGLLAENGEGQYGLLTDDTTQDRLAKAILGPLFQEMSGNSSVGNVMARLFGVKAEDIPKIEFQHDSKTDRWDVTSSDVDKLKNLKFGKEFFINSFDVLQQAFDNDEVSGTDGRIYHGMGDFIQNRYRNIPGLGQQIKIERLAKDGRSTNVPPEVIRQLRLSGYEVTDDGKIVVNQQLQDQLAGEIEEARSMEKLSAEGLQFLDVEEAADRILKYNPADSVYKLGKTQSPTRIGSELLPFGGTRPTTQYEEIIKRIDAQLEGRQSLEEQQQALEEYKQNSGDFLGLASAGDLKQVASDFKTFERGSVIHTMAQSMLEAARQGKYDLLNPNLELTNPESWDQFANGVNAATLNRIPQIGKNVDARFSDKGGAAFQLQRYKQHLSVLSTEGQHTVDKEIEQMKAIAGALAKLIAQDTGATTPEELAAQLGGAEGASWAPLPDGEGGWKNISGRTDYTFLKKTQGAGDYIGSGAFLTEIANLNANHKELNLSEQNAVEARQGLSRYLKEHPLTEQSTSEEKDLYQEISELASRGDRDLTDQLTWVIGDIKTAKFANKPSLNNIVQMLHYMRNAQIMRSVAQNARGSLGVGTDEYQDAQAEILAAMSGTGDKTLAELKSGEGGAGKLFKQFLGHINQHPNGGKPSVFESLLYQYDGYNKLDPESSESKAIRQQVEDDLFAAYFAKNVQGKFYKAGMQEGAVRAYDLDPTQLLKNPLGLKILGKISSGGGAYSYLNGTEGQSAFTAAEEEVLNSLITTEVDQVKAYKSQGNTQEYDDVLKLINSIQTDFSKVYSLQQKAHEALQEGNKVYEEQLNKEIDLLTKNYSDLDQEGSTLQTLSKKLGSLSAEEQQQLAQSFGITGYSTSMGVDVLAQLLKQGAIKQQSVTERGKRSASLADAKKWQKGSYELANLQHELDKTGNRLYMPGLSQEEQDEIQQQQEELQASIVGYKDYLDGLKDIYALRNDEGQYVDRDGNVLKEGQEKVYSDSFNRIQKITEDKVAKQKQQIIDSDYKSFVALGNQYGATTTQINSLRGILKGQKGQLTEAETAELQMQLSDLERQLDEEIMPKIQEIQGTYGKRQSGKDSPIKIDKNGQVIFEGDNARFGVVEKVIGQARQANRKGSVEGQRAQQLASVQYDLRKRHEAAQVYGQVSNTEFSIWKNQQLIEKASREGDNTSVKILEAENEQLKQLLEEANLRRDQYNGKPHGGNAAEQELANLRLQKQKENFMKASQPGGKNNQAGIFGLAGNTLGDVFKRMFTGYGLQRIFMQLVQSIQKLGNEAKALDKILTNLRIVTGDTRADTKNLINEYSELAKSIGATTKEVAASAVEWMRQGYESAEVIDLVTSSMYLSKLGMIDSASATKNLTSALKGFKLQANQSMEVVDKLTAIDLKAATSAGDIAEGLSKFANLGSLAGVNIDQAAAYVATISDVTQMSGSSAGQALKTIISRYGNVKAGAYNRLNVNADNAESTEAVNDVEKVLRKIGVSVRDTALQFRDFDVIMADIAEKWSQLDKVSQKAIANAFAGVRQQEAFVTLMQNWDKYEELLATSENSKGTATKKYESYKESYEADKNALTTAIEKMMNSNEMITVLKTLTQMATKLVDFIPSILKWGSQLFLAVQSVRGFTGTSLVHKAFNGMKKAGMFEGFTKFTPGTTPAGTIGKGIRAGVRNIVRVVGGKTGIETADKLEDMGVAVGHAYRERFPSKEEKGRRINAVNAMREQNFREKVLASRDTAALPSANARYYKDISKEERAQAEAILKKNGAITEDMSMSKTRAAVMEEVNKTRGQKLDQYVTDMKTLDTNQENPSLVYASKMKDITAEEAEQLRLEKAKTAELEKQKQGEKDKTAETAKQQQAEQTQTSEDAKQNVSEQSQTINDQQQAASEQMQTINDQQQLAAEQMQTMNDAQQAAMGSAGGGRVPKSGVPKGKPPKGKAPKGGGGMGAGGAILGGISIGLSILSSMGSTYATAGNTHQNAAGETVNSSDEAKATGKAISTGLAAIPMIGPMIDQMFKISENAMKEIDSARDAADLTTKKAEKDLKILSTTSKDAQKLSSLVNSTGAETEKEVQATLKEIRDTMYASENTALRANFESYLQEIAINTENSGLTLDSVLEKYERGQGEERKEAAKMLEIAQKKSELDAERRKTASENYKHQQAFGQEYLDFRKGGTHYAVDQKSGKIKEVESFDSRGFSGQNSSTVGWKTAGATGGTLLATAGAVAGAGAIAAATGGPVGWVVGIGAAIAAGVTAIVGWVEHSRAVEEEKARIINEWNKKDLQQQRAVIEDNRKDAQNVVDQLTAKTDELSRTEKEQLKAARQQLTKTDELLRAYNDQINYLRNQQDKENRLIVETAAVSSRDSRGNYISDLSLAAAKSLGPQAIYEAIANATLKEGGLEGNNVYSYFTNNGEAVLGSQQKILDQYLAGTLSQKELDENAELINSFKNGDIVKEFSASFLKIADSVVAADPELAAAAGGQKYTLREILNNGALDKNKQIDKRLLQVFADSLGTTIDELFNNKSKYSNKYGSLTLAELNQNSSQMLESTDKYLGLMSQINEAGGSATKWMNEIVTQFPDLIQYMSDMPQLMEQIFIKIKDLAQAQIQAQLQDYLDSGEFYTNVVRKSMIENAEDQEKMKKLLDDSGANDITGIMQYMNSLDSNSQEYKMLQEGLLKATEGYDLTSDAYKEAVGQFIEYNASLLDKQIDNLEKQKEAIQAIITQREYENKLIEARLRLEEASQSKKRVYREGVGFVYQADNSAIREAQDNLKEVEKEKDISEIDQQITNLQDQKAEWENAQRREKEALEEQRAEAFQTEFLDKWGSTETNIKSIKDTIEATNALFKDGYTVKLDTAVLDKLANNQTAKTSAVSELVDAKASLDKAKSGYESGTIGAKDYKAAQDNYKKVFSEVSGKGYINKAEVYGGKNGTSASGEDLYEAAQAEDIYVEPKSLLSSNALDKNLWWKVTKHDVPLNSKQKGYIEGDIKHAMGKHGSADDAIIWTKDHVEGVPFSDLPSDIPAPVDGDTLEDYAQRLKSKGISEAIIVGSKGGDEWARLSEGAVHGVQVATMKKSEYKDKIQPTWDYDKKYKKGTVDSQLGHHLINEDGVEAIVTPHGTITALPSHTGVIPADITKNLWELGQVSPRILEFMNTFSRIGDITTLAHQGQSIDESLRIANLVMNVNADEGFDAEAFVRSIKDRVALTRNIKY